MSKYKDELANVYSEIIEEGQKAPGNVDSGRGFTDGDKDVSGKGYKDTGPENSDADTSPDAPEALSSRSKGATKDQKDAKGSKKGKKADSVVGESAFDALFNQTMLQEMPMDADENPIEGDAYDTDQGDFPEVGVADTDEEEEVEVGTEIALIIDRLKEIAAAIGAPIEDESEFGGEEEGDAIGEPADEFAGAGGVAEEAFEVDGSPKQFAGDVSGVQKNKIVKGAVKVKKTKVQTGGDGKDRSGKASIAPSTTLGPNMSMKVDGTGPAAQGGGKVSAVED